MKQTGVGPTKAQVQPQPQPQPQPHDNDKDNEIYILKDCSQILTLRKAAQKQARNITTHDLSRLARGAVVIARGRIAWVGPQSKIPKDFVTPKTQSISLKGMTLLPGFVDCHTHMVFSGSRSHEFEMRNQGQTYQDIARQGGGIRATVSAVSKTSEAELIRLAQARLNESLKQGVTTIEIKSGYGLSLTNELKSLRVIQKLKGAQIISTYLGAHTFESNGSADDCVKRLIHSDLGIVKAENLAQRVDIFVEKGYFTLRHAQQYAQKAKSLGLDLVVHADQLSRTGATRFACLNRARSADHLVCINKKDIELLSKSSTVGVLLPTADFYLRLAYPPARNLIDSGACVALATDYNPGSAPSQDIFFAGILARLEMGMSLSEVIVAFTVGGSFALGLQHEVGSIEVGKAAHFAVVSCDWQEMFYEVGTNPVSQVWYQGKRVEF